MFGDLNEVKLIGRVTKDLEAKVLKNDNAVLSFDLATESRYQKDGEWVKRSEYHKVVIWGKLAVNVAKWGQKGSKMFVSGKLTTRKWDNNGVVKYVTEVVANNVILIDKIRTKDEVNGVKVKKAEKKEPDIFDDKDKEFADLVF